MLQAQSPEITSSWAGYFVSQDNTVIGEITKWYFYNNNTVTGKWGSHKINLNTCTGTFSLLDNGEKTITCHGLATLKEDPAVQCEYTLEISGTFSETTGNGEFTITFSLPALGILQGKWLVQKLPSAP
jgi:hypothetical protein